MGVYEAYKAKIGKEQQEYYENFIHMKTAEYILNEKMEPVFKDLAPQKEEYERLLKTKNEVNNMETKIEFVYAETEIRDGNMLISWGAKNVGFGQLEVSVLEDGKLIMYTECMGKEFAKSLFEYIVENSLMS